MIIDPYLCSVFRNSKNIHSMAILVCFICAKKFLFSLFFITSLSQFHANLQRLVDHRKCKKFSLSITNSFIISIWEIVCNRKCDITRSFFAKLFNWKSTSLCNFLYYSREIFGCGISCFKQITSILKKLFSITIMMLVNCKSSISNNPKIYQL